MEIRDLRDRTTRPVVGFMPDRQGRLTPAFRGGPLHLWQQAGLGWSPNPLYSTITRAACAETGTQALEEKQWTIRSLA
jgi:hypothetical protein